MVSGPDVLDAVMQALATPVASVMAVAVDAGVVPDAGGQEPAVKVTSPSGLAVAVAVEVPSAGIDCGDNWTATALGELGMGGAGGQASALAAPPPNERPHSATAVETVTTMALARRRAVCCLTTLATRPTPSRP